MGWLDGVLLRYAVRISRLTELVITKLDVLSGLETLKLCVAYRKDGQTYADLPSGPTELAGYEPVYETFPGWSEDVRGLRRWDDLPAAARAYLEAVSRAGGHSRAPGQRWPGAGADCRTLTPACVFPRCGAAI